MNKKTFLLIFLFVSSGILYYYMVTPQKTIVSSKVDSVIDGDTLNLENGLKIRLLGINTPEKGNWLYLEAKDFLFNKTINKTASVEIIGQDKYNRSLGYVFVDGLNINRLILEEGLATTYFYEKDSYYSSFIDAEEKAIINQKGLWKKSINYGCIEILEFNYIEKTKRCSDEEILSLKNNCDKKLSLIIKDDATHIYKREIDPYSNLVMNFSCTFNDASDTLYIYDSQGLLTFYRYS